MSYDEHLISQAGGDGDPLDAIQRRADKLAGRAPSPAERDRRDLLALVGEQAAQLDKVRGLATYLDALTSGDKHYAILIRATLELKP